MLFICKIIQKNKSGLKFFYSPLSSLWLSHRPASETHLTILSLQPAARLFRSRSFQCYFSVWFNDTELNMLGFIVTSTHRSVFKKKLSVN